jgi:hypothetical protein
VFRSASEETLVSYAQALGLPECIPLRWLKMKQSVDADDGYDESDGPP